MAFFWNRITLANYGAWAWLYDKGLFRLLRWTEKLDKYESNNWSKNKLKLCIKFLLVANKLAKIQMQSIK